MSQDGDRPVLVVLFGATGDLAARMVLPAFFTLAERGLLPEHWRLIGNGRGDTSHDEFREHVAKVLGDRGPDLGEAWDRYQDQVFFAGGGFSEEDPGSLWDVIREAGEGLEDPQLVHYLALPPSTFEPVTAALQQHGLAENARVVYEKPYGTSQAGFEQLDRRVHEAFDEEQVFRIDHFLGKEATQDLHVLRFANQVFAGVWNREHVAEVQIDVPETLDIDDRAEFYDATGATLDMLVTHLVQVAAEIAMEPPLSLGAEDLTDAREAVISAFRPIDPADVVLGQYEGYRDVEGVADDSRTDTFVAARLWVDTDRWHGVPFLLRTGKRMAISKQQVSLVFREVEGSPVRGQGRTALRITLDDSGHLDLDLTVKEPGPDLDLASGTASLDLAAVADAAPLPAYASLLHDVLRGDRSLFTSRDGLAAVWRCGQPLLDHLPEVQPYPQGSWGPAAANDLSPTGWLLGP